MWNILVIFYQILSISTVYIAILQCISYKLNFFSLKLGTLFHFFPSLASLHLHPCPFHNDFDLGMVVLILFAHLGSGKSLKCISQQLLVFPFVKFQGIQNMFIRSIYVKYNCHFLANLHLMEHLLCWKSCHSFRVLFPPNKIYFLFYKFWFCH